MRGNVVNPKYILFMSLKHLYECAKILACAEILSLATETYSPCAETYSLCAETYVLAWKYFQVPVNFLVVRGNYYVPCVDFGLLTILGMPSSHDYVIDLMLAVSASQVDFRTPLHIVFQTNLILSYLIS